MTLPSNEQQIILTEVTLKTAKSDSVLRMTPEREDYWDAMVTEVADIERRGNAVLIPNEWPDLSTYELGKVTPLEDT